ncbi:MAG: hypothetical protein EOP18_12875 [Rhizobiaceae bacterium]|nr:MAG: hypothetical protein EOP18_12875 [Rhizobiaceae bacterium]
MRTLEQDLADFGKLLREPLDRISASKIVFALYDARAIVSNERLIDIETDVYLLRSSKTSKRPPYVRDVTRMLADAAKWSQNLAGAFPCLDEDCHSPLTRGKTMFGLNQLFRQRILQSRILSPLDFESRALLVELSRLIGDIVEERRHVIERRFTFGKRFSEPTSRIAGQLL